MLGSEKKKWTTQYRQRKWKRGATTVEVENQRRIVVRTDIEEIKTQIYKDWEKVKKWNEKQSVREGNSWGLRQDTSRRERERESYSWFSQKIEVPGLSI